MQQLLLAAEAELEAALRGASLCSVSRDPSRGTADVKWREGYWYTLRDVQRQLEGGAAPDAAVTEVSTTLEARTPTGAAWTSYRAGATQALADARAALAG